MALDSLLETRRISEMVIANKTTREISTLTVLIDQSLN